jgi:putative transposase/transposase-like zinc-binding protein
MPTLADVVRTHGADYLSQHSLSFLERKTIEALLACRSGSLGSNLYQCADCRQKHFVHRSCGNRHCPGCQQHKTRQWVLRQLSRQLPVSYFLLTFTVPQPLRRFLRSHKRPGYEALFQASSQALKKLARDPRLLGSDLAGFTGVLHTWGRQLQYHPHVHYLIPAGAVSGDRKQWLATSENFFLPVQALSVIFRAKFRDAMDQAGLLDLIPAEVWHQPWVVHCQPVGDGTRALQYLARYVFRVAIANSRILSCQDGVVTFSFRDKKRGNPVACACKPWSSSAASWIICSPAASKRSATTASSAPPARSHSIASACSSLRKPAVPCCWICLPPSPHPDRFVRTVAAACACWPSSCPPIASALSLRWSTQVKRAKDSSRNRASHRRFS